MAVSSSSDSEGWLGAIEDNVFDATPAEEKKHSAALEYAARRRQRSWRLSHTGLFDGAGTATLETCRGTINFEHHPGQQQRAWDCSLVLAKYVEACAEEIKGKRVLELGCGVGIPGIAAALMGASDVTLTDLGEARPAVERTIALNPSVASLVSWQELRWGDEASAARLCSPRPLGVILCSDLVYDSPGGAAGASAGAGPETGVDVGPGAGAGDRAGEGTAGALVNTLCSLCTASALVLSCHERRWAGDGGRAFFAALEARGFSWEAVDPGVADPRFGGDDMVVLGRLRRVDPLCL